MIPALRDFYIILHIKRLRYMPHKIGITVATSHDNWEIEGLRTKIDSIKGFNVETFDHPGFVSYMQGLLDENSNRLIHIVGDKYMDDMVPKFGFHAEFHGKHPQIKKLIGQLDEKYLLEEK